MVGTLHSPTAPSLLQAGMLLHTPSLPSLRSPRTRVRLFGQCLTQPHPSPWLPIPNLLRFLRNNALILFPGGLYQLLPPIHTRPRRARQNSPSHRECWQEAIWQTTCLEETNVSEPPNHLIANKRSPHVNNYGDPGTVSSSVEGGSWQPGNTPWQGEKLRFLVNAGGMSTCKPAWVFPGVASGSGWPRR